MFGNSEVDVALDLIEKRVAHLESLILPPEYDHSAQRIEDMTDSLLRSQSMFNTALTCRDTVLKTLQRLPQLDKLLDPLYPWDEMDLALKKQYILSLYPQLKKVVGEIQKYNALRQYEDVGDLEKIFVLSDKLQAALVANADIYQDSTAVTMQVVTCLQEYHDIISSFAMLFAQMDKSITTIELQLKPVSNLDD